MAYDKMSLGPPKKGVEEFKHNGRDLNFKLSDDQQAALDKLMLFLHNKERAIVLTGSAGTGKSTIMKEFITICQQEGVECTLCAPTHRAALVLRNSTGQDAITIHKLLALKPNVNIAKLDMKKLQFICGNSQLFPYKGIVIIDEASMVTDAMFDTLVNKAEEEDCKILAVGDPAQLAPVEQENRTKIFKLPNMVKLTKIHRQAMDNPIIPILTELRTEPKNHFEGLVSEKGSMIVYTDAKQFMMDSKPYYEEMIETGNILKIKMMAFRNVRVQAFNACIRKMLFGDLADQEEFIVKEIVTGYDNFEGGMIKFHNSMDYVVTKVSELKVKQLTPEITIKGYDLTLYDAEDDIEDSVFIMSKKHNEREIVDSLAYEIEAIRLQAINIKSPKDQRKRNMLWSRYFTLVNSFASMEDLVFDGRIVKSKTFDYGYALTVHKCQGSSVEVAFVDVKDFQYCTDQEALRQLQYVGLSRTKNNIYLLQ